MGYIQADPEFPIQADPEFPGIPPRNSQSASTIIRGTPSLLRYGPQSGHRCCRTILLFILHNLRAFRTLPARRRPVLSCQETNHVSVLACLEPIREKPDASRRLTRRATQHHWQVRQAFERSEPACRTKPIFRVSKRQVSFCCVQRLPGWGSEANAFYDGQTQLQKCTPTRKIAPSYRLLSMPCTRSQLASSWGQTARAGSKVARPTPCGPFWKMCISAGTPALCNAS